MRIALQRYICYKCMNILKLERGDNISKPFSKKFYKSTQWQKCRESYIASVFGLCERCQRPGYIVHHKVHLTPDNINDPFVTLNHDNLEYLCKKCHDAEHEFGVSKSISDGYYFNELGEVVEK